MTVAELIRELKKQSPGMRVKIESAERHSGYVFHDNISGMISAELWSGSGKYLLLETGNDDPDRKII